MNESTKGGAEPLEKGKRRLDSMARFLESGAECAAVALINNVLYVTSNSAHSTTQGPREAPRKELIFLKKFMIHLMAIKEALNKISAVDKEELKKEAIELLLENYAGKLHAKYKTIYSWEHAVSNDEIKIIIEDLLDNKCEYKQMNNDYFYDKFPNIGNTEDFKNLTNKEKWKKEEKITAIRCTYSSIRRDVKDYLKVCLSLEKGNLKNVENFNILIIGQEKDHAEMRLLAYLLSTDDFFEVSTDKNNLVLKNSIYLGISKLCCKKCMETLSDFNEFCDSSIQVEIGKDSFNTNLSIQVRGDHGLSFSWRAPEFLINKDYFNSEQIRKKKTNASVKKIIPLCYSYKEKKWKEIYPKISEEILGVIEKNIQKKLNNNKKASSISKRKASSEHSQIDMYADESSSPVESQEIFLSKKIKIISDFEKNIGENITKDNFFEEFEENNINEPINLKYCYQDNVLELILKGKIDKNTDLSSLKTKDIKSFCCMGETGSNGLFICERYPKEKFYVAIGDVTDLGNENQFYAGNKAVSYGIDFLSLIGGKSDDVLFTVCDALLKKPNLDNKSSKLWQQSFFIECRLQHGIEEEKIEKMETYQALEKCKDAVEAKNFLEKVLREGRHPTVFKEILSLILKENAFVKNARIIVPLNKGNGHWVSLELILRYDYSNKQLDIEIFQHDPYGQGKIDIKYQVKLQKKLDDLLTKELLPELCPKVTFEVYYSFSESPYEARQSFNDTTSCGAIVIEDVILLAKGDSLNRGVYPTGCEALRKVHQEIYKNTQKSENNNNNNDYDDKNNDNLEKKF